MKVGNDSSMSARLRPPLASPRSMAGMVVCRRYCSVVKPWTNMPSQTSPPTSVIFSPRRGQEHPGRAVARRAGVEERRHEGVAVELALEAERLVFLPRPPDGPGGPDQLPHPGGRVGDTRGE